MEADTKHRFDVAIEWVRAHHRDVGGVSSIIFGYPFTIFIGHIPEERFESFKHLFTGQQCTMTGVRDSRNYRVVDRDTGLAIMWSTFPPDDVRESTERITL